MKFKKFRSIKIESFRALYSHSLPRVPVSIFRKRGPGPWRTDVTLQFRKTAVLSFHSTAVASALNPRFIPPEIGLRLSRRPLCLFARSEE